MTLVLDLEPELEARLRAEAFRQGITVEQLCINLIIAALDEYDAEKAAASQTE